MTKKHRDQAVSFARGPSCRAYEIADGMGFAVAPTSRSRVRPPGRGDERR